AAFLYGIALLTGLTYNEINIIVYYFVIPFSWLWMLDKYFHFHWLKIAFLLFCIVFFVVCEDFLIFSNDLFNKSVVFLEWFRRFNMDYIVSSVVICVIAPIMIYAVLAVLLHRRKKRDAADEPKKR
ncbi:MAG: hypothetical protein LBR10_15070, partial [Prevotellaceae bacterium]|nr:hypothetical protein [Prevotellaceae bacterium]